MISSTPIKKSRLLRFGLMAALLFFSENLFAQGNVLIFEDDFNGSSLAEWQVENETTGEANWYLDEGFVVQDNNIGSGNQRGTNLIRKNMSFDNFTLRTQLDCTDDDYIGVVFRYTDPDNYYKFVLSSEWELMRLQKRVNGSLTLLDSKEGTEWQLVGFNITVTAYDNELKVYLNDELYLEAEDSQFSSGSIGLMCCYNNGAFFDWVRVYETFEIPAVNNELMINRGPYLQSLTDSSVSVLWGTNKMTSSGQLEIGQDTLSYQTISENKTTVNHEIEVSDLLEETVYYYRVKSGDSTTAWASFMTFPPYPASSSFMVYGDNRTNFLRHSEVLDNFSDHDFDFIINTGDIIQRGLRDDWNVEFFNPLQEYIKEKPIYCSIGNHELNADNFYNYFAFPNAEHENYYSYTLGSAFFVFIDNNSAAYPDDPEYPSIKAGSAQYIWLEEQLSSDEAAAAEWLFVIGHVPSYYNGTFDTFPDCRDYLVPLFEEYGVDFSISGHMHGYERGFVNNVNYIVTGGGGGSGPVKDDGYVNPGEPPENYPFRGIYNFCKIEINETELDFTAYDIFGNEIDNKIISASSISSNADNTVLSSELFDAYPNPFNSVTKIPYVLSQPGNVTLTIYNALGQNIATLVNKAQPRGKYEITFDASNLPSGVYFYRLQNIPSEGSGRRYFESKKFILLK